MILYFAPGTCARVSLTALEEIGEPFGTRLIAFMAGEHRKPEFLAINPAGKVPALITPEGPLVQNSAILWYLAKVFPDAGLLPRAETQMEEARLLSALVRFPSDLHPIVTRIVLPHMFCDIAEARGQVRAKAEEAMRFQLSSVEKELSGKPWLLGSDWSILDAYLGWIWFRITGAGFEPGGFPAISAHHLRLNERPSVQRALARDAQAQAELESRGLAIPNLKNS